MDNKQKYQSLIQYATPGSRVHELLTRLIAGESMRGACGQMNIDSGNGRDYIRRLEQRAAKRGWAPAYDMTHTVPEGFAVRGVSTLYNADGNITAQWVKSRSVEEQQLQAIHDRLDKGDTGFKPFKPTKPPAKVDDDLLSLLTITDFHLGEYCWGLECGDDWDMNIARQVFLDGINDMVKAAPPSGIGVYNQLGDMTHWDGLLAITPSSGHVLDPDGRFGKLVDIAMDVNAEAIKIMLGRFGKVHVIHAEGNHDQASSVWLRKHFKHIFANDPRVMIDDSERPFYALMHGKTMLGFHHGHKVKMQQLPRVFASDPMYRAMWGEALYCYIHCGHYHREEVFEDGGAIVERHPTLSARDSYATRLGLVSKRGAKVITYDNKGSEVSRVTVRPRYYG